MPPVVPVLQVFHRHAAHDRKPIAAFLRAQAFCIHFGLQRRQLVHIRAVLQVIVRFYAFAACPGAAHNRAKRINRHLFIFLVQPFDFGQARLHRFYRQVVLARIDKSAVDQRINGQNHRVCLAGMFVYPVHQFVRLAMKIRTGQIPFRRRNHSIPGFFGSPHGIGKINGTIVLRHIQNSPCQCSWPDTDQYTDYSSP